VFSYANIGHLKVKLPVYWNTVSALVSMYIFLIPLCVTVHHSVGTREGTQFYSCHIYKFGPNILKVTYVVLDVVSWCHRVVRLMCTDLSETISDEGGTKFPESSVNILAYMVSHSEEGNKQTCFKVYYSLKNEYATINIGSLTQ